MPPIKISWLKKFEGDDMFQATVLNQSQLEFQWDTAEVRGTIGICKSPDL